MRTFLDDILMTRITSLSAGGELQHQQLEQSTKLASQESKPKSRKSEKIYGKQKRAKSHVIPDRKSLHEAHHFLIQTYVEGADSDE